MLIVSFDFTFVVFYEILTGLIPILRGSSLTNVELQNADWKIVKKLVFLEGFRSKSRRLSLYCGATSRT